MREAVSGGVGAAREQLREDLGKQERLIGDSAFAVELSARVIGHEGQSLSPMEKASHYCDGTDQLKSIFNTAACLGFTSPHVHAN